VVTSSPRRIRAHDLATGREVWWFEDGTQVKVPSPVIAGDRAIVTGGYAPGTRPTWAIPLSATGLVAADDLAWQIDRGSPYTTTPVAYDGVLYMVTDAGILSAYDVVTGERLYQERLGGGAGFSASPVLADDRLYAASEDGDVFVVRAGRTFELLATNSVGQIVMATPAIAGDQLIVRGVADLFAFSR
jgi:outer membrane protein assembly factor BamB